MNDVFELINKTDWFIGPIARLFLFLFTTKSGWTLLAILLFFYIVFTVFYAMYSRRLLASAAKSGYGRGLMTAEKLYIFLSEIGKVLSKLLFNLPVVIGIFVFFVFIGAMSAGYQKIDDFIENNNRIKELNAVIRQLDKSYKVAEVHVQNVDYAEFPKVKTSLLVKYYDYAGLGLSGKDQAIEIEGNDIYFDALVLNFEYSEITNGQKTNIAIPYRLFSNVVSQKNGVELNLNDTTGIPFLYHKNEDDIFCLDLDTYNKRLAEVCSYFKDPKVARKNGVRSIYGNAVHTVVRKDDVFTVSVEQTGGLILRKNSQF